MMKLIDTFKNWFTILQKEDQFAFICTVLFWLFLGLILMANKIVHI